MADQRYFVDCREQPSEMDCSLYIAGTREEVVAAAAQHAVAWHGHEDNEELRAQISAGLRRE